MLDVFLVHNSQDKTHVRVIANELKQRGISLWFDEEQIPPGRPFQDFIQEAIPNVRSAAIFIGQLGLGKWQTMELRAFISKCVETNVPVIPVLLPGIHEFPEHLIFMKELNWISFANSIDDINALNRLVWGITGRRPQTELSEDSRYIQMRIRELMITDLEHNSIDVSGIWHRNDLTFRTLLKRCCLAHPGKNPTELRQRLFEARSKAYDEKYSQRRKEEDERYMDFSTWEAELRTLILKLGFRDLRHVRAINVGIGNGTECPSFYYDFEKFIGVDISQKSLELAQHRFPQMQTIWSAAENLEDVSHNSQDLYISLRTYQSTLFSIEDAVLEAYRVTRPGGGCIISVSNAHKEGQNIVYGILRSGSDEVDFDLPYEIINKIRAELTRLDFEHVGIHTGEFEIYAYGRKTR